MDEAVSLIGHDNALNQFWGSITRGRAHHAWLLTGPKGLGKFGFAAQLTGQFLSVEAGAEPKREQPATRPCLAMLSAGSHPDFRLLRPRPKEEDSKNLPTIRGFHETEPRERKRNISVDQVRQIRPLLQEVPSQGRYRIIIIDAADDLEAAGANALLKSLEEPPRDTIFFLISHAPDRLLPTIRSRCQLLRFDPVEDTAVAELLAQRCPQLSASDRDLIVTAARGAPGQALRYAACDWGKAETQLRDVMRAGVSPVQAASELGRLLLGKANLERFDMFVQRAPAAAAEVIRELPSPRLIEGVDIWRQIVELTDLVDARALDRQMVISRICDLMTRLAAHRGI